MASGLHGLVEEFLTASEHNKPVVLEKISRALMEAEKLASLKDNLVLEKSYMRYFAEFRGKLRQLLYNYGVLSNPGWDDDDIIDALDKLLKEKGERQT